MKRIFAVGLLIKKEGSYNGGGSLNAATDGFLLEEPVKVVSSYAYDGARAAPPGILGYQRRVTPTGRTTVYQPKHAAKGAGAAYSSSVVPSIHTMLQIAGFDAAGSFTGGSEKWTYTPTAVTGTPASGVASAYGRDQLYPSQGIYADLNITGDSAAPPVWEFPLMGLAGTAFSDVTLPAITYPLITIDPPKNTNIAFTIGNFTAGIIRKWSFKMGRTIAPALDQNSNGHGGFRPGRRTPTLSVTYEATTLQSTPFTASNQIDPYQLFEAGTNFACSVGPIGSVQYNKWSLTAGAAQIAKPPVDDDDGPTALVTLDLQLNPTTLNNNDDVTLLFN